MAEERLEEYEEETEEEEELSSVEMLEAELKSLYREMKRFPKTSEEYMVLCQRSTDLTEQIRNMKEGEKDAIQAEEMKRQRWVPYCQIAGNVFGNAIGSAVGQWFNRRTVNDVLNCERDGYIVQSKATSFMQKPRN